MRNCIFNNFKKSCLLLLALGIRALGNVANDNAMPIAKANPSQRRGRTWRKTQRFLGFEIRRGLEFINLEKTRIQFYPAFIPIRGKTKTIHFWSQTQLGSQLRQKHRNFNAPILLKLQRVQRF